MNLFEPFGLSSSNNGIPNGNQRDELLISIALKQFETANTLYTESEKIKSALRNLEEHTENEWTALAEINSKAEEALFRIIMEKISLQAELHKLTE